MNPKTYSVMRILLEVLGYHAPDDPKPSPLNKDCDSTDTPSICLLLMQNGALATFLTAPAPTNGIADSANRPAPTVE